MCNKPGMRVIVLPPLAMKKTKRDDHMFPLPTDIFNSELLFFRTCEAIFSHYDSPSSISIYFPCCRAFKDQFWNAVNSTGCKGDFFSLNHCFCVSAYISTMLA